MSLDSCIKAIEGMSKSYSRLMCAYCGTETVAVGDKAACSNCESMAYSSRSMLAGRDADLVRTLDAINALVQLEGYDKAVQVYERLNTDREELPFLYAEALLYIRYSNYQMSLIAYDREGFMDENIAFKDNALKCTSESKRLLAKLITTARDDIEKGSVSINIAYSLFLAQLKFGDLRGAKSSLAVLKNLNNDYVYTYASMAFDSVMGNFDSAAVHAESLLKQESFSINAAYYLAFSYFKKKRFKDSERLLNVAQKYLNSERIEALMEDMEELTSSY